MSKKDELRSENDGLRAALERAEAINKNPARRAKEARDRAAVVGLERLRLAVRLTELAADLVELSHQASSQLKDKR